MLWIPPGFAHGFCALTDVADLAYNCTAFYAAASDRAICWDDPEIGIAWPIATPTLMPPRRGCAMRRRCRSIHALKPERPARRRRGAARIAAHG